MSDHAIALLIANGHVLATLERTRGDASPSGAMPEHLIGAARTYLAPRNPTSFADLANEAAGNPEPRPYHPAKPRVEDVHTHRYVIELPAVRGRYVADTRTALPPRGPAGAPWSTIPDLRAHLRRRGVADHEVRIAGEPASTLEGLPLFPVEVLRIQTTVERAVVHRPAHDAAQALTDARRDAEAGLLARLDWTPVSIPAPVHVVAHPDQEPTA